jgi:hypothetical protein
MGVRYFARHGAAALLLLAFAAAPLRACTCNEWPDFDEALAQSSLIVLGTVLSIEPDDVTPDELDIVVTIQRHSIWRGPHTPTVQVRTWENEAVCGYPFSVGQSYLVYGESAPAMTHLCARTHSEWPGDPDIARLGPPIVTVGVAPVSWARAKSLYQ